jgi:methylenetetrahydrofolate reductase (NADPH)
MLVKEALQKGSSVISFEFFPPKTPEEEEALFQNLERLRKWNPTFVSVTYGAGGTTKDKSLELAQRIKEQGLNVVAHLTCAGATKEELAQTLDWLQKRGIENLLALRGDPPQGEREFKPVPGGFQYAYQLVEFIKRNWDFCVGVAGYPEGHIENPDKEADLQYLKLKVDKGADFVVTQLFFDNSHFYSFVDKARAIGIQAPIIPGIMSITNLKQVIRFTRLCGATIPEGLIKTMEKAGNPEEVRRLGIQHAYNQCRDLLNHGIKALHFYTLNRSRATEAILTELLGEP